MIKFAHATLFVMLAARFAPAQSNIALSLTGNAVATPQGSIYRYIMGGNGSVTGFGNATLAGTGIIDDITIRTQAPIEGTFTLIFSAGDVLVGTLSIPAGVLIPSIGGSTSATGTAKIIGGTGKFAGATGAFSNLTGSGTATSETSTSFQVSGTGSISTSTTPVPGVLTNAGSIAHLAAGGGWKTTMTFVNTGARASQLHLSIFDEAGNSLPLLVSFPQTPSTPVSQASTIDRTLAAGAVLIVECPGDKQAVVGSAQLQSDGPITGSVIFRDTNSGQEAVVPVETRNPSAFVIPFDNTGGLVTGVAFANVANSLDSVKIVITDDAGVNNIVTDTINLAARGHAYFVLQDKYSLTRNRRGTITFQPASGGQISVVGIRAAISGAYTSIPPAAK